MTTRNFSRREFFKTSAAAALCASLAPQQTFALDSPLQATPFPRWRGFNLLDYFGAEAPAANHPSLTKPDDFKWMADWGFDFVRIPMAYPRYVSHKKGKAITPDEILQFDNRVVDQIEALVQQANSYNLHVSLNLHRAPGFCVNAGFTEPYNLWKDAEAQQAFYAHWEMWAKRLASFSREKLSFDLVNEPCMREDMNDQFGERTTVPGDIYRKLAQTSLETIRKYNPHRIVVADGNDVGATVIPEIADLDIAQSCRGYFPHHISHNRAGWVYKDPKTAPKAEWPGMLDGKMYDRALLEEFYRPWIELAKSGVGVHCGECGCYNKTPHEVFLKWFGDVLDIFTQNNIGYALWNFRGDFGVLDSGRTDVAYEDWHGHKLDRKMLQLLQRY